jgi:hypothetical protein
MVALSVLLLGWIIVLKVMKSFFSKGKNFNTEEKRNT